MTGFLEVCVDSLASARAAIAGGADRLELCSALSIGGLTPWPELLQQIRRESNIPIRCLMRPRAGDFLYEPEEIQQMAMQIPILRSLGADGFVIGCLTAEGTLDTDAMAPLREAAKGCGITLHRCIDVSRDLSETYSAAAALGIDTILTSGGGGNCVSGKDGIEMLLKLRDTTGGPEVLIGSGVNADVIVRFLQWCPNATAFHMSGKRNLESRMRYRKEGVPMGIPGYDEWHIPATDEAAIRAAKQMLSK